MSDEYKVRKLRDLDPPAATPTTLRANSLMRWSPLRAVLEQQDHVPATSRRKVAEYGLNGSNTWHVPDDTTGDPNNAGGAQLYPDDMWRLVERQVFTLTPGCMLEGHVLYVGAGTVQKDTGGGFFIHDGAWGEVRVGLTLTSADGLSTTGPHYFSLLMPGSGKGDYGGGENEGGGEDWITLQEKLIKSIQPDDFATDATVSSVYSEGAVAEVTIELSGAPRIAHMAVYEMPLVHVQAHDASDEQSVHALPAGLAPLTSRPVEKGVDGVYAEPRFGTTRMMNVAATQAEHLGPIILGISCWEEDAGLFDQAEGDPFTTTSTTFDDLYDSTNSTWTADNPGHIVAASHAQLHRLCDENMILRGEAAVIPVTVRVDAQASVTAGVVRVQSSPYEWVDVAIPVAARSDYTAVGYLYSQVHADHAAANVQVFFKAGAAGTTDVYYVSVEFGHGR
jgi:hypothetical protein